MAEKLKLRWGSYSDTWAKTAVGSDEVGTIFVTKDEGGIYLGVDADKAPKRLQGVVQFYSDLTHFTEATKPPYSTEVIYYLAAENALFRWDDKAKSFIILNVTATEFNDLKSTVNSHLTDIESAKIFEQVAKIDAIEGAIAALEELIGGNTEGGEGVTSLISRIDELGNNQVLILKDIEELEKNFLDIEGTYETQKNASETYKQINEKIDAISGENGLIDQLDDRLTALDKTDGRIEKIEDALDDVYTKTEADSIFYTQKAAQTDFQKITDRIAAIDGTSGTIANLDARLTALDKADGRIEKIEEDLSEAVTNTDFENYQNTVEQTYYTLAAAEALKSELLNNVEAANCLTYHGAIGSQSDFNHLFVKKSDSDPDPEPIKIGYTYIITNNLTIDLDISSETTKEEYFYAGDLLIASGTEGEDGVLTNIDWIHINTGYQSSHNSALEASGSTNKATIQLTSLNGDGNTGDCGQVDFNTSNNMFITQNMKTIKGDDGKDVIVPLPEFTFGLQWLEF